MYVHIQQKHTYVCIYLCIYFTYIRIAVHILLFSAHLTQFHKFSLGTHVAWMLVSTLSMHCNCTFLKLFLFYENFTLCFLLICCFFSNLCVIFSIQLICMWNNARDGVEQRKKNKLIKQKTVCLLRLHNVHVRDIL